MNELTDRIALIGRSGARLASFAGLPSRETVDRLHSAGLLVVATVGAPRHARKMVGVGVDALIAQGGEGGGHTGTIPTSLLLPQVVEVVGGRVPVLGAGGSYSGRGLAAMVLEEAVVTSAIDWKPQRVIATPFVKSLERTPHLTRLPRAAMAAWRFRNVTGTSFVALIRQGLQKRVDQALNWSQLALAANAPMLTRAALVEADLTAGIMPAGQVAGIITGLPSVAEPRAQIRNEVEESHGRLAGMRTVG